MTFNWNGLGATIQQANITLLFAYSPQFGLSASANTFNPDELVLSNGAADTFTVTTKEVDLTGASILPQGFSLNAATGVVSTDGLTTTPGVYTFGLVATDTNGLTAETDVVITLS